jgi:DNA-directed RNA polymerase specialized sigma24 family protein
MNSMDENDGSLIARHAQGDAEAFELIYRRHEMRTWRYLERNVGNRANADELQQEVWFAVSKEAPRFEPKMRFSAWLFGIAYKRLSDCRELGTGQRSGGSARPGDGANTSPRATPTRAARRIPAANGR